MVRDNELWLAMAIPVVLVLFMVFMLMGCTIPWHVG